MIHMAFADSQNNEYVVVALSSEAVVARGMMEECDVTPCGDRVHG